MTDHDQTTAPGSAVSDPVTDEEYVPVDDAVIGRAFRWSVVVFVGVGVLVVGVLLWSNRETEQSAKVVDKDPGAIENVAQPTETAPSVKFTDITAAAGLDFKHATGATGEKLLPETMGAGAAFFDYDDDGDQDILFVNATHWPDTLVATAPPTLALYRNDGAGVFTNATNGSGLDISFYGMGVAVGDFDNDGQVDVYITAVGANHLFHNDGGYFRDVTDEHDVAGGDTTWSSSAGFFDYDNDGDLDLFVCNYVQWSREKDIEVNYTLNGRDRAYGPPTNYLGSHPTLYRNDGEMGFTDVSAEAGLEVRNAATELPVAKSLAVAPIDLDGDGWIDIIVANDTTQNFMFHNQGDGTFAEKGAESGMAFDNMGGATGAMGIDSAFFRNDESLAVAIGNFANEMTSFYVSQGELLFSDGTIAEGIGSPSRVSLTFGLFFFDYDLDGRLDLLQTNGHLEETINEIQSSQHYHQSPQLFWNAGPGSRTGFAVVPAEALGDLATPIAGRGATYADIDGDGDLDVLLTQVGDRPLLVRNDQDLGRHWLRIKLEGTTDNRDGIGAWIELTADGRLHRRQVMPTRSYLSQVELPVTFGLDDAASIESIRVLWPGGDIQDVDATNLEVDSLLTIRQIAN